MYEFEVNDAILHILDKSFDKDKTAAIVSFAAGLLKEYQIAITDYRWQALVNHLSAMVERSFTGEILDWIEKEMFSEVSQESLLIAGQIVNKIGNLPEGEMYLLSVHFETAQMD